MNNCCGVLKQRKRRCSFEKWGTIMHGNVTRNGHGVSCSGNLAISSSGNVPKQRMGNRQGEKEGERRKVEGNINNRRIKERSE
jgi:hypothetical protein